MTTGFFGTGPTTNLPQTAFSTPSLFPTTATTPATGAASGTGLFGTGMQQPSAGFGTGGLFANNPAMTQPAASTSSGFSLGSAGTLFTTTTVPTTTQASFFGGFGPTTVSATKSSFGLNTTTSVPASTGFFGFGTGQPPMTSASSFGLAPTTSTGLFSGLGAIPSTLAAPGSLGFSMTTAQPTVATSSIGLGGIDLAQSTPGLAGSSIVGAKGDNKAVKEIPVPHEVVQTVEAYKKYVKDQKNIREEITRISAKPLNKVQEETASLRNLLSVVSNAIQRNVVVVDKLKQETAQELKNVEIAQRTKDTPHGLQYENTAPTEYFHHLVDTFETRMKLFRIKIDQMEKYLSHSQSLQLSALEFTQLMKQIHETFIALAAELHSVHESVKLQKEHYSNYRKVFYGDLSEPFQVTLTPNKEVGTMKLPSTMGPTPFSGMSSAAAMAMASAYNKAQQPSTANAPPTLGLNSSTGLGLGLGSFGSLGGLGAPNFSFGTSTVKPLGSFESALGSGSVAFDSSTLGYGSLGGNFGYSGSAPATPLYQKPLMLQKPPLGNKRGKRVAHN